MRDARWLTSSVIGLGVVLLYGHASADGRKQHAHRGADPEQLVRRDGSNIANGCGPGWTTGLDASSWRFANKHTYQVGSYGYCEGLPSSDPGSCDGTTWTYEVDFRDACHLHDVGYEGRYGVIADGKWVEWSLVYDRILDIDVDFSRSSRQEI